MSCSVYGGVTFRNALVGISGFSEMIGNHETTLEEARGFAADLDRIEAGRLTMNMQSVDLNALLQDAVERAGATSSRHTIVEPAFSIAQGRRDGSGKLLHD